MTTLAMPMARSRATKSGTTEFRRVRGREGLTAIKADWDEVIRQMERVYLHQRYEWYQSYVEALEDDDARMNFIVAYRNGEPRAIYPLRHQAATLFGIPARVLTVPQHAHLPHVDFIHRRADEDRGLLGDLITFLRSQKDLRWDLICVPNAVNGSAAEFAVQDLPPARRYSREQKGCNYLPCQGPYDQLRKTFSKNLRANLNTSRNRLAREGTADYVFAREQSTLDAALREFIELEGSGWKGSAGEGSAIQHSPALVGFYQALTRHFGAGGDCEIRLLRLNGRAIAGGFYLRSGGREYTVKIGYDETKHALSPGSLLLDASLREICEDGTIEFVDWMSNSAWCLPWGAETAVIWRHLISNATPRGMAVLAIHHARALLRPAVARLRKSWKTAADRMSRFSLATEVKSG
jgi:CelD/BcsL family acetyltransferase involved in cellulose biosynthesis